MVAIKKPLEFKDMQEGHKMFVPFGPHIVYSRLPEKIIKSLNMYVDAKMQQKKDKALDHSEHLVGKVTQELAWDEEIKEKVLAELSNFIAGWVAWSHQRTHVWNEQLDMSKFDYGIQVMSAWYVRQF